MSQFQYDESGNTSTVFLLGVTAMYLIPTTFRRIRGLFSKRREHVDDSKRHLSAQSKGFLSRLPSFSTMFYILVWGLFIFSAYKASTFEPEPYYDPYEVLGLSPLASKADIKKKYRDLSLKFHPDRNINDPDAAKKFIRIAKAYDALTDEVTRENWEKYGNPDGPQAATYGIALPTWIIQKDNHKLVLAMYFLLLVLFAVGVAIWWYRSRRFLRSEVLVNTALFYVGGMFRNPNITVTSALELLCFAEEFSKVRRVFADEVPQLARVLDLKIKKWRAGLGNLLAYVLFNAHLNTHDPRIVIHNPEMRAELNNFLRRVPTLAQVMLDSINDASRVWINKHRTAPHFLGNTLAVMHLQQMLIQGFPDKAESLMQVPHFDDSCVFYCRKKKIFTVPQFFALTDDAIRTDVLRSLPASELDDIIAFGNKFPFVRASVELRVKGTEDETKLTAGALVTAEVTITRMNLVDYRAHLAAEAAAAAAGSDKPAIDEAKPAEASSKKKAFKKNAGGKKGGKGGKKAKSKQGTGQSKSTANGAAGADDSAAAMAKLSIDDDANGDDAADDDDDDDDENNDKSKNDGFADSDDSAEDLNPDGGAHDDDSGSESESEMKKPERKEKAVLLAKEDSESPFAYCPLFPEAHMEQWWVFLGDTRTRELKTPVQKVKNLRDEVTVELMFRAPQKGKHTLTLFVVSDSYLRHEIQETINMNVLEAEEDAMPPEELLDDDNNKHSEDDAFDVESESSGADDDDE
eukprot:m.139141 g.139141  ORF g.139141 m.139141 type:complete len:746 (-) comp16650_c0_seq1:769-3006(-)